VGLKNPKTPLHFAEQNATRFYDQITSVIWNSLRRLRRFSKIYALHDKKTQRFMNTCRSGEWPRPWCVVPAKMVCPRKQADDRTRVLRELKTKYSRKPVPVTDETLAVLRNYLEHHWRQNPGDCSPLETVAQPNAAAL
jgi:hypothetical protein